MKAAIALLLLLCPAAAFLRPSFLGNAVRPVSMPSSSVSTIRRTEPLRMGLLKGLDPILSADLLHVLRSAGHGDIIVVCGE